jgi:predicted site-specific integrase-resolvase
MAKADSNGNGRKTEAVFIRKSTREQDETGQKGNVESMLRELGVCVPLDLWFEGTVSRRKVKANAAFLRLMEMVENDRISTVYVESQDRWGTKDRPELFSLLGILREHGTKLFDLRGKKDLTERDFATELLAFVGSVTSEKELQAISYRSLRSRVQQFKETGSWPTGTHPYGYGKACCAPDGTLKWEWHPVNRKIGQVFYPGPNGLTAGPANVKLIRKDKRDITKLVPNRNADYVRAAQLIFDLYTRVGLSRRQIAVRLNAEGLLFNGGPFAHTNISDILRNPAYAGDTVFGKLQTGELHTFDATGAIVEVKEARDNRHRDISLCLIKRETHKPLVDRKTWELAQQKLASEGERTSHAPRNPAYYLKQIFVCGHCGRSMSARTEISPTNGRRTVVYVCSSYLKGRIDGVPVQCGYQRITHEDAERLLLEKIKELSLPFEKAASEGARDNLQEQLARLGHDDEESSRRWQTWLHDGINDFADYLNELYRPDYKVLKRLRNLALDAYCGDETNGRTSARLPLALREFRKVLRQAEEAAVKQAKRKLAELRQEHKALTLNWVKATDDMQVVLRQEIEDREADIREWEPRTLGITERLSKLYEAEGERQAERERLSAEWPKLESREKGEALRRLFHTVKLYWDRTFHPPERNPSRPRKTERAGRYAYSLQTDRIEWHFATSDSVTSW